MILLTRLDQSPVLIHMDSVKYIESVPDTLISFTNGDRLMVKESLEEITVKYISFRSDILKQSHNETKDP